MKKEGSKREHGPTFCFDFWVRFGDHRALYHIPIVIIPTLEPPDSKLFAKQNNYVLNRLWLSSTWFSKCFNFNRDVANWL